MYITCIWKQYTNFGNIKNYTTLSNPNKRAPGWSLVVQSKSVTLAVSSKVGWKLRTYNGRRSWGTKSNLISFLVK